GDGTYNKLIDKSDEFIEEEKYAEARDTLEDALEEKENDVYATDTIAQLDIMIDIPEKIGEEEPSVLIGQLDKINTYDKGSTDLMDLAEQYMEQLQTMDELLTQVDKLEEESKYEEAIAKVNDTLESDE